VPVGVDPNGLNINDKVGATKPESLRRAVLDSGAEIGIALDGDADRLIMADGDGRLYDGDELLYVIVSAQLTHAKVDGVVGTLMSNLAFEQALTRLDVPFARAKVGDRYVLEVMHERGWKLGGENSGHIICLDKHTTGDGIVSALQVLAALRRRGVTLVQACEDLVLFPQKLINVRLKPGFDWRTRPAIEQAALEAERTLGDAGRVLLRPSGTEPLLRVMVEGRDERLVNKLAGSIAAVVESAAG